MCLMKKPAMPKPAAAMLPDPNNAEARRQADLEAALRRRRAGAAADILTSPVGLPSGSGSSGQLGKVAA